MSRYCSIKISPCPSSEGLFQPENCPGILRKNPGLLEKQRFASRCR
jgi:hypothetical protein